MSQSVAVLGSNQVPLAYQVPVPGTLTALSATAVFDGSGAADFQPCLSFYDSDGNLLARATAQTVVAGASAEVSWFPRVASQAAAPPPSSSTINWAYIGAGSPVNCPAGTTTIVPADAASFYTDASSIFASGVDGSGNAGIVIKTAGHYLSIFTAGPFGVPTAGSLYELSQVNGGTASGFELPPNTILFPAGAITDNGRVSEGLISTVGGSTMPPTDPIIGQVDNTGPHDVTIVMDGLFVMQLDTNNTDIF